MLTPNLAFGSFDFICSQTALPLCPLVGTSLVTPSCYARNIEVAGGGLLFEPATIFMECIAILMTAVMIYNIRSKYVAVGRKEFVVLFYLYVATLVNEFLLVSGVIPMASGAYKYFVATHIGLIVCAFWSLMFNGFVACQLWEDGTPKSLWLLRGTTFACFFLSFLLSILTFTSSAGLSSSSPIPLFILYLLLPASFLIIYVVTQTILVVNSLDDRWVLGDLAFGALLYAVGLALQFGLSTAVCNAANHYIDGIFFGCVFTLLAVMMVYKFWDSVTREDLEFTVATTGVGETTQLLVNR
ncbi:chitin synthase III catalytic subunit [Chytriomyces sp. MP71]|nr:chitin synthase III catalytic subunit [Chytriomyces sp. MP71]